MYIVNHEWYWVETTSTFGPEIHQCKWMYMCAALFIHCLPLHLLERCLCYFFSSLRKVFSAEHCLTELYPLSKWPFKHSMKQFKLFMRNRLKLTHALNQFISNRLRRLINPHCFYREPLHLLTSAYTHPSIRSHTDVSAAGVDAPPHPVLLWLLLPPAHQKDPRCSCCAVRVCVLFCTVRQRLCL